MQQSPRLLSLHPNTQRKLEKLAADGHHDASLILDLVGACHLWLDTVKDLHLALGLVGDEDEVLNGAMDDAYTQFLAPLLKRAGRFDELYWHITPTMTLEALAHFYHRVHDRYPTKLWLNYRHYVPMQRATSILVEGQEIEVGYLKKAPHTGQDLGGDRWEMLMAWSPDEFDTGKPRPEYVATVADLAEIEKSYANDDEEDIDL